MNLHINGEPFTLMQPTLPRVLEAWGAKPPYAIAINQQFIPKHEWANIELKPGDEIEVLTPISGG